MRYGIHPATDRIPPLFRELSLPPETIYQTQDGFTASNRSLAELLTRRGIDTFPNAGGEQRRCDLFFDDWYLYSIPSEGGFCYSLFKMREQEYNAQRGEIGDGDTPGVTVCFIEFDSEALTRCLADPSRENRSALNQEINRVVVSRRQRHHHALKDYFRRPQAQAPYLIAELYVRFIAGLAQDGSLPVPIAYARQYSRSPRSRLSRFLEENNARAGYPVCDHGRITIRAQKSRWGSCSTLGNLNFNCLLMLCPQEVRDYVVVHELCHRKEMNHSERFWRELARVLPDYETPRKWLKTNGSGLIRRLP